MAIDLYDRVQDNMAAIAASLNALRAIERHGGRKSWIAPSRGFTALPAPDAFDPWAALGLHPGATREAIEAAFRAHSKKHHPDAPGGSTEAFPAHRKARRGGAGGMTTLAEANEAPKQCQQQRFGMRGLLRGE
jgi:hypothetical protein